MRLSAALVALLSLPLWGAPRACVGGLPVGSFELSVLPPKSGVPLPVRTVNALSAGDKLQYQPLQLPPSAKPKAEIAVILVPSGNEPSRDLIVLDPTRASEQAQWDVPKPIAVVALVFGPQGLSMKKVRSLVNKNQDVLNQLADYAKQTSQVEGLVQALATSEQTGGSLEAALNGFSAQYNVAVPKLDTKAPTDQQATALMKALLPSLNTYDPLAPSRAAVMQQSAGLAASVAALFFGSPVGLAAGGASLFQNLRTVMFPDTEFRSAFAQGADADGLALCAKPQPAKSRTKMAYLWAHRVPDLPAPRVALAGPVHVPIGSKSLLKVTAPASAVKELARARDWRLAGPSASYPAVVMPTASGDAIEIDLTKTRAPAGEYHLAAKWDWQDLAVPGEVWLHPYGNLNAARFTRASLDRLVEGSGRVAVQLTGADFQFVDRVALEKAGKRLQNPQPLDYTLPLGARAGEQKTLDAEMDTTALGRGEYRLLVTQSDNLTHEIPFTILPPHPRLEYLPVRLNLGEPEQRLHLSGTGLTRLEAILTDAGQVKLAPPGGDAARDAVVKLAATAKKGEDFPIRMKVQGIEQPVTVDRALIIAGPRPRITNSQKSISADGGIALEADEVPAGAEVSFALSAEHVDPGGPLTVTVSCAGANGLRRKLTLAPGDTAGAARLNVAGEGLLFLSLDPAVVGQSGCPLTAVVTTSDEGASDAFALGRVVRVPRIEQFTLTDQKIGDNLYAGVLQGRDLDTIEKAGWDAHNGVPVQAIPTPVPGQPQKQMLKIALPWPAPAPHAPVFVWLRGEASGRATGVKY